MRNNLLVSLIAFTAVSTANGPVLADSSDDPFTRPMGERSIIFYAPRHVPELARNNNCEQFLSTVAMKTNAAWQKGEQYRLPNVVARFDKSHVVLSVDPSLPPEEELSLFTFDMTPTQRKYVEFVFNRPIGEWHRQMVRNDLASIPDYDGLVELFDERQAKFDQFQESATTAMQLLAVAISDTAIPLEKFDAVFTFGAWNYQSRTHALLCNMTVPFGLPAEGVLATAMPAQLAKPAKPVKPAKPTKLTKTKEPTECGRPIGHTKVITLPAPIASRTSKQTLSLEYGYWDANRPSSSSMNLYMAELLPAIAGKWIRLDDKSRVHVVCNLYRDGRISHLKVHYAERASEAAKLAALHAVATSAPFPHLPEGSSDVMVVQFSFDCDEKDQTNLSLEAQSSIPPTGAGDAFATSGTAGIPIGPARDRFGSVTTAGDNSPSRPCRTNKFILQYPAYVVSVGAAPSVQDSESVGYASVLPDTQ